MAYCDATNSWINANCRPVSPHLPDYYSHEQSSVEMNNAIHFKLFYPQFSTILSKLSLPLLCHLKPMLCHRMDFNLNLNSSNTAMNTHQLLTVVNFAIHILIYTGQQKYLNFCRDTFPIYCMRYTKCFVNIASFLKLRWTSMICRSIRRHRKYHDVSEVLHGQSKIRC